MYKNLENKYKNKSFIYNIYPSFYLILKEYNLSKKKIIDLWASNWRYIKLFWEWSCWVEYWEVDRVEAVKNWLNVVFWNLNKEFDFFKNENFDFIFSSHVIEHLESPYLFLKNIRKFGWDNAKLILWFPIEFSLVRIIDPYFLHDWHIYSFSKQNIIKLLNETWFCLEKIYYDIPFAWRWKIFNFLQKIVQSLPYCMVSWWSNAIYIVAKKV